MIGLNERVFKIPNAHFVIEKDMLDDEVLNPPGFRTHLIESGLQPVGITDEELVLAIAYEHYAALSYYDRAALALANELSICPIPMVGLERRYLTGLSVALIRTLL